MKRILKYCLVLVIIPTLSVSAFLCGVYFTRPSCKFCHVTENVMLTRVVYTTDLCLDYLDLAVPPFGVLGMRGRPYKVDNPDWDPSIFYASGSYRGKTLESTLKRRGFWEWWCLKCCKPAVQAVENHASY